MYVRPISLDMDDHCTAANNDNCICATDNSNCDYCKFNFTEMAINWQHEVGDRVVADYQGILYTAKVLNRRLAGDDIHEYHIHYEGFNKNWDEWIDESLTMKGNETNLKCFAIERQAIQDKLDEEKKAKAEAKALKKQLKEEKKIQKELDKQKNKKKRGRPPGKKASNTSDSNLKAPSTSQEKNSDTPNSNAIASQSSKKKHNNTPDSNSKSSPSSQKRTINSSISNSQAPSPLSKKRKKSPVSNLPEVNAKNSNKLKNKSRKSTDKENNSAPPAEPKKRGRPPLKRPSTLNIDATKPKRKKNKCTSTDDLDSFDNEILQYPEIWGRVKQKQNKRAVKNDSNKVVNDSNKVVNNSNNSKFSAPKLKKRGRPAKKKQIKENIKPIDIKSIIRTSRNLKVVIKDLKFSDFKHIVKLKLKKRLLSQEKANTSAIKKTQSYGIKGCILSVNRLPITIEGTNKSVNNSSTKPAFRKKGPISQEKASTSAVETTQSSGKKNNIVSVNHLSNTVNSANKSVTAKSVEPTLEKRGPISQEKASTSAVETTQSSDKKNNIISVNRLSNTVHSSNKSVIANSAEPTSEKRGEISQFDRPSTSKMVMIQPIGEKNNSTSSFSSREIYQYRRYLPIEFPPILNERLICDQRYINEDQMVLNFPLPYKTIACVVHAYVESKSTTKSKLKAFELGVTILNYFNSIVFKDIMYPLEKKMSVQNMGIIQFMSNFQIFKNINKDVFVFHNVLKPKKIWSHVCGPTHLLRLFKFIPPNVTDRIQTKRKISGLTVDDFQDFLNFLARRYGSFFEDEKYTSFYNLVL